MHATPKPAVATTVAVDLAKDVFELAYADAQGRIVARRRLGRAAFAREFDNHTPLHIVMEACGSAHHLFPSGRHFASSLGLTPREHSSGTRRRLGRVTKRGDVYLRMLLIHGARAVLRSAKVARQRQQPLDRPRAWPLALAERVGHNKAAVALANKTARRLWAAEHHRTSFDPDHVGAPASTP